MKKPNRKPDFEVFLHDKNNPMEFYFEEMVQSYRNYKDYISISIDNGIFYYDGNSYELLVENNILINAYKEWQFNSKIKEILCES